jgi:SAM-dependent methyltransferase
MSRLSFATRVLLNQGSDKSCPFCGSPDTRLTARKQMILQLRTCTVCGLRFRWPKETPSFSEKFYQASYQETGFTTELPSPAELSGFIAQNFAGSPKDFARPISILREFQPPPARILDYGCSWGYGAYQLQKAGYQVTGFEISRPRAALGRDQLGIEILDSLDDLPRIPAQSFDGIFASHVLEHLSSPKDTFELFARILKPGGIALILVPNGGGQAARELGVRWSTLINEKHVLALDGAFFEKNLPAFGFQVRAFADPYVVPELRAAFDRGLVLPSDIGEELVVIARRTLDPS